MHRHALRVLGRDRHGHARRNGCGQKNHPRQHRLGVDQGPAAAGEHDGPRRAPVHLQSRFEKPRIGWEQFVKGFDFWMDPRFKATGLDIRDLRIDFSPGGDSAWWSCILDDLDEWDGKPIGWKDTRWSGVMEKRQRRMADRADALLLRLRQGRRRCQGPPANAGSGRPAGRQRLYRGLVQRGQPPGWNTCCIRNSCGASRQ